MRFVAHVDGDGLEGDFVLEQDHRYSLGVGGGLADEHFEHRVRGGEARWNRLIWVGYGRPKPRVMIKQFKGGSTLRKCIAPQSCDGELS